MKCYTYRLYRGCCASELAIEFHEDIGTVLWCILNHVTRLDALRHYTEADVAVALDALVIFGALVGKNDQKDLRSELHLITGCMEGLIDGLCNIWDASNDWWIGVFNLASMGAIELHVIL